MNWIDFPHNTVFQITHKIPNSTILKQRSEKENICMGQSGEIINVIEEYFRAGITKDMSRLRDIQLDDLRFSSFSDLPPYDIKGYKETIELEELKFVSISDYAYKVKNPKISIYDDKMAIVATELIQTGMIVNNKAFTGEHMTICGRATFVLIKKEVWKIVHIHLSKIN